MSTWIVIAIVAGALLWLSWRFYVTPSLYQMEGVEKIAFVVMTWGMGACMLGLAPSVVYAQLCASIGVVLLGLGALKGVPPILRWWYERPYWKAVTLAARAENDRLEQEVRAAGQLARAAATTERREAEKAA